MLGGLCGIVSEFMLGGLCGIVPYGIRQFSFCPGVSVN